MELEPEQIQLFFEMVEAARAAPRDQREWRALAAGGGTEILQGPGGRREVILSDVHELERVGLLRPVPGTDGGYLIPPEGYTRYDEMKHDQGEPVEEGAGNEPAAPAAQPTDPKKVMVVHGRDSEANDAMFDFLRALDLKPQEWTTLVSYTHSGAPYVGDVLAGGFSNAQAVVVLLTPDDEARLSEELRGEHEPAHETALMGQARPNVLFEAGMAFVAHPERTIVVELGTLRPFSDIHGRHTIRLDGSVPPLREIARRLQAAGCPVDESGDDWLRADRFPAPRHRGGSSTADGAGRKELLTAAAGAVTNALDAFERRKGATDENVTERGEAFDASVHEVALLANQVAIEFGQQHLAARAYERALTWLRTLKAMAFDAQATALPAGLGEDAAKAAREAASEFIGAAQAS